MMSGTPEMSNDRSEAQAERACREVRKDIVALQRDELSPLRAESVRLHLGSCPECREEALELDLAIRGYAKLPQLVPSPDLASATMRRVREESGLGGRPPARVVASPCVPAPPCAERESVPAGRRQKLLRRTISNPFVRVAVAALLFITVLILRHDKVADAAGRAQQTLLGARASEAVDRARDAFLRKLRL